MKYNIASKPTREQLDHCNINVISVNITRFIPVQRGVKVKRINKMTYTQMSDTQLATKGFGSMFS